MTDYHLFLSSIEVLSEEEFNDVVNAFPKVDLEDCDFGNLHDYSDKEEIGMLIVDYYLDGIGYCDCVNFDKKELTLMDIDTQEDLDKITETFKKYGWVIENYDQLKTDIKEAQEEADDTERRQSKLIVFNSFVDKISMEELQKLATQYGKD